MVDVMVDVSMLNLDRLSVNVLAVVGNMQNTGIKDHFPRHLLCFNLNR